MNCTHYLNTPFKYAPLILPLSTSFYLKIDYRQRAIPLGNWYIGIFGLYGHAAFSPPSSKIEKFCKLHVCIIAYFIGNGCLFEGSVRKRNKASSEVCCCVIKRRRHSVASNLTMPRPPLIYPLPDSVWNILSQGVLYFVREPFGNIQALLLLRGSQYNGLNIFKEKEICPKNTQPNSKPK